MTVEEPKVRLITSVMASFLSRELPRLYELSIISDKYAFNLAVRNFLIFMPNKIKEACRDLTKEIENLKTQEEKASYSVSLKLIDRMITELDNRGYFEISATPVPIGELDREE